MFTQFFGNYLLNGGLVTREALSEALKNQKNTRMKLGVLAINAGLMTAAQVEAAHQRQQQVDKRIGDVMVEMGFISKEQVEELFSAQPSGHLLLGQALVDSGSMTNAQFEEALSSYKKEYSITDDDLKNESEDSVRKLMAKFYGFDAGEKSLMSEYVYLLFKNIIRFIGDDFTPAEAHGIEGGVSRCVSQAVKGENVDAVTAITGTEQALIGFASRFAKEELSANDEYTQACVSEFLNLHNGLYTVNISNDLGTELTLSPQEYSVTKSASELPEACVIPLSFPFGTMEFILSM